jgi:hypothetical protein
VAADVDGAVVAAGWPRRTLAMSMDPDGMNRILKQQIKEWHAVVDGERQAHALEPHPKRRMASGIAWARRALGVGSSVIVAFRHRRPERPVV